MAASELSGESMLCARCARALGDGSSPFSVPPSLDFESASQVAGQVMFPQWGTEGKG